MERFRKQLSAIIRGLESQSLLIGQFHELVEQLTALLDGVSSQSGPSIDKLHDLSAAASANHTSPREHLTALGKELCGIEALLDQSLSAARGATDLAKSLIVTQRSHLSLMQEMTALMVGQINSGDEGVTKRDEQRAAEPVVSSSEPAGPAIAPGEVIYICYRPHQHERVYAENAVSYLQSIGVAGKAIELDDDGAGDGLRHLLDAEPQTIVGFNSLLDQARLPNGSAFLAEAEDRNTPVIQWIVDHPSSRWHEFGVSNTKNSRYLLNSRFAIDYFKTYCLPGARTAAMGGIGPNRLSRVPRMSWGTFTARPATCVIPLSLNRHCGGPDEVQHRTKALGTDLAHAIETATERAMFDLMGPLEAHLKASLEEADLDVSNEIFNRCFNLVEAAVQIRRRTRIFEVARNFPVVIQSDRSAAPYLAGAKASWAPDVDMPSTLRNMPQYRAVLSVSPLNDMVHDRVMNALNAGCVAVVEDNLAHQSVFADRDSALFFRYNDDSLDEALDLICSSPGEAYKVATHGFALRGDPRLSFGDFHNLVRMAID